MKKAPPFGEKGKLVWNITTDLSGFIGYFQCPERFRFTHKSLDHWSSLLCGRIQTQFSEKFFYFMWWCVILGTKECVTVNISYLFDFDGTLVDSMPTFVSTMLRILDENHVAYSKDITKIITPLGLNGTTDYFINTLGMDMPREQLMLRMKEYILEAYFYKIPAKPHVIATLQELKRRGASLNVLTASPHITLDACLKRLGMWELFDHIWSCDDFHTTKADPKIYAMAAQRLNTTVDKVLFLDDNLHANTVAKSAGMQVCGVYDASSEEDVDAIKAVADFYIYDFEELLQLK